jgi:hypothetical protein
MQEKNSNIEKKCLPKIPFTEMTYHVRGCMTFRLSKQDSAMNRPFLLISDGQTARHWYTITGNRLPVTGRSPSLVYLLPVTAL